MLMCRAPSALALPLPLILVLASASGCSWFCGSIELTLLPPEPPPHWVRAFPELAFELRSPDSFGAPWVPPCGGEPGDLGHPGVLGELGDLGALGDLAALRLPKKGNWPVLAYPLARGTRLMPAGALYPQDLTSDGLGLQLSWEHGPAAEVLLALANEGFDVSRVNAERLIAEMTDRSNADPWSLDLAFLGQRLFTGEFRLTDIRLLPSRALTLEVPVPACSPRRAGGRVFAAGGHAGLPPAVPGGCRRGLGPVRDRDGSASAAFRVKAGSSSQHGALKEIADAGIKC
jgi:hypothetical protein